MGGSVNIVLYSVGGGYVCYWWWEAGDAWATGGRPVPKWVIGVSYSYVLL